ncbi:DUF3293 domain-containing protein [Kozakia baliensis]|uniref:DUF3293 domain-containing protein n=1 Tax=Kozakia baliensis TaxID=153496 RepID=A0A1D8UUX0_9PROT|nr:DUF3293 domain-containing protein [Kozakia baliensis]AOX17307.1 hypothetical protein A0U89_09350 [Kozakia baliensis]
MNTVRPPSPAARSAYVRSLYRAPGLRVRIGRRPCGWPLPGRSIVLLSACNPAGVRLPDDVNAHRMGLLEDALRNVPHLLGEGRLGQWSEALFAAAMPLAPACRLARRFGQNAVVALRPGRAAFLVWLA